MRMFISIIYILFYYSFAQYLPSSNTPFGIGKLSKWIRYIICKNIFKKIGNNVNIEPRVDFGWGRNICIGDNSGLGENSDIQDFIDFGKNVMMGHEVKIIRRNHCFNRMDIPICQQGYSAKSKLVVGDDVWFGTRVVILPSCRRIGKGAIIGACSVVTKDIPDYAIVGGNPARIIRIRI